MALEGTGDNDNNIVHCAYELSGSLIYMLVRGTGGTGTELVKNENLIF